MAGTACDNNGAGMSKHDDKVIPTLDDVIQPGDFDDTRIGDLNALEDDFDYPQYDIQNEDQNESQRKASTDEYDSVELGDAPDFEDDSFDDAFGKLVVVAEPSSATDGLDLAIFENPDSETVQLDPDMNTDLDSGFDSHPDHPIDDSELDDIAELIVAERFPPDAAEPATTGSASEPSPEPEALSPAPDKTNDAATPAATKAAATNNRAEIKISQLVDDITHQLMPEIEWKIRTRVRDILEQHFPDQE